MAAPAKSAAAVHERSPTSISHIPAAGCRGATFWHVHGDEDTVAGRSLRSVTRRSAQDALRYAVARHSTICPNPPRLACLGHQRREITRAADGHHGTQCAELCRADPNGQGRWRRARPYCRGDQSGDQIRPSNEPPKSLIQTRCLEDRSQLSEPDSSDAKLLAEAKKRNRILSETLNLPAASKRRRSMCVPSRAQRLRAAQRECRERD
jgi:hypothetical protein